MYNGLLPIFKLWYLPKIRQVDGYKIHRKNFNRPKKKIVCENNFKKNNITGLKKWCKLSKQKLRSSTLVAMLLLLSTLYYYYYWRYIWRPSNRHTVILLQKYTHHFHEENISWNWFHTKKFPPPKNTLSFFQFLQFFEKR